MMKKIAGIIAALAFATLLSSPATAQGFQEKTAGDYTITNAWVGKVTFIDGTIDGVVGQSNITVPDPATVDAGRLTIVKRDNLAGTVRLQAAAGVTMNGWDHLILQVQNDSIDLYNTGSRWYPFANSKTPAKGPLSAGVHRTIVASAYENNAYGASANDVGGVLRVKTDNSDMMIVLPSRGDIGHPVQGYSATTTVCVQWNYDSSPAYNVKVFGNGGDSVNGVTHYQLPTRGRQYCFNYDSTAWTLID